MSYAVAHQSTNLDTITPRTAKPSHRVCNSMMSSHDSVISRLQRTIGSNQAVQSLVRSEDKNINGLDFPKIAIQPKLEIIQSSDIYEQEADRVAEQVMRMTDLSYSVKPIATAKNERMVNRNCADCTKEKEDDKKFKISRKPSTTDMSNVEAKGKIANEIDNIGFSGGSSLDGNTKEFMESRFGYNFSNVKMHTDERAARSASSLNALAYTVRNNIVFGERQYRADTTEGKRLIAHELAHVIQQRGSESGGVTRAHINNGRFNNPEYGIRPRRIHLTTQYESIQRFEGTEHEKLGDITGVREIDLGNGVVLSWGQMVALAGDYYESIEQLLEDTKTDGGKARIRASLEFYGSPNINATSLPIPAKEREEQAAGEVKQRYLSLVLENIPHFVAGGTAIETWLDYHARSIDRAILAGLANEHQALNMAYALEAFGQHFLTDAFSAGHIRTPRREIADWYVGVFAPRVMDHFIEHLREGLVNGIYDQLRATGQKPWYAPEGIVKGKIRNAINEQINRLINGLRGGRDELIRWFGLIVGGVVSGAIHDMEGKRGLTVGNLARPETWRALGDKLLRESPETEDQAKQAILAAKGDVDNAFLIGLKERTLREKIEEPTALPRTIYFAFNSDELSGRATLSLLDAASYMTYHPEASVNLVGHTDPVGRRSYNMNLGLRRADIMAKFLIDKGVHPSRVGTDTAGEMEPVTTNPREYWKNRRVEMIWHERNIAAAPSDVGYDRASKEALRDIGPPYKAQRFFPTAVTGENPPIPDWHWGSISPILKEEISKWIKDKLEHEVAGLLSRRELDPINIEGYRIELRPILQNMINELLGDPVAFMERAFGEAAGPTQ